MVRLCTPGDGRPSRSSPRLAQKRIQSAQTIARSSLDLGIQLSDASPSARSKGHTSFCDGIDDIENMDPNQHAKHDTDFVKTGQRKVSFAHSHESSVEPSGRKRPKLAGFSKSKRSALPPLTESQHTLTQLRYVRQAQLDRPPKRRRLPPGRTLKHEQLTITQMPSIKVRYESPASGSEDDHLGYDEKDEEMCDADQVVSTVGKHQLTSSAYNSTGRRMEIPDSDDEGLEEDVEQDITERPQPAVVDSQSSTTAQHGKIQSMASSLLLPNLATQPEDCATFDATSARTTSTAKRAIDIALSEDGRATTKMAQEQLRTPRKRIVAFVPSSQSPQSCLSTPSKSDTRDNHSPSKGRRRRQKTESPTNAEDQAKSPLGANSYSLNRVDAIHMSFQSNKWKSSSSFNVEHPVSSPDRNSRNDQSSISDTDTGTDYDSDHKSPVSALSDMRFTNRATVETFSSHAQPTKVSTPVLQQIKKDIESENRPTGTATSSGNQNPTAVPDKVSPTKARVAQMNALWAEMKRGVEGSSRRELRSIHKAPPFVASSTRTSTWSTADEETSHLGELETQFDIGEDTQAELQTIANPETTNTMTGDEQDADLVRIARSNPHNVPSLPVFDTGLQSKKTSDREPVSKYCIEYTNVDDYSDPRTSQEQVTAQLLSETQALAHQRRECRSPSNSGLISGFDKQSHASIRPSQATTVGSSPASTPRTSQRYRLLSPSQSLLFIERTPHTKHVKPLLQQSLPIDAVLAARSSSLPPQPPSPELASSPPLHPRSSQVGPSFHLMQGSIPTATQLLPESLLDDSIPLPPPWND